MNRSLLLLATLFFLLLGVAGREAEAAGPPIAPRRAGELIVRFRPGAAPAAPALEAPAAATSGKPATPREAFAFTPAAKFSNPYRPASLKALDQRFGLREARPLGAPARPRASKKNQLGPLSSNQGAPLSLAPRFNAAVAQKANPSNRFNGFSRPDNAAPASAIPTSASPAASSSNTVAPAAPLAETWLLCLDPAADLNAALAAYRSDPAVLYAEPNYEGVLAFVPSDPLYSQESKNFKLIGLERAWDVRPGASRGVEVAVIDSGIDAAHPDLAGALDLAGSYNFAENNTRIYDDIGHGTRVAGVIGATAANGEGIAGVAFGCRLMSLDVATSAGVITTANVASAIDWAVAKGADVINLSLTFSAFSQPLSDACQAAMASGVVVVAAAGNENQGERAVYPASYSGVLGVGAVSADGRRAPWSNYNGTCAGLVDLVAPGEAVFSTIPNGQYNGSYGSGTSFATPMVSGVAALLKTRYPAQSGQAIAAHLLATAAPVSAAFDPPNGAGSGLLSAQNALATAMQPELALGPVTVDDTSTATAANDGNGRLARGEKATLRVKLKNSGADADLISAALTTTDPAITIGDGAGTWGAIKNGEEAGPSDPFTNITVATTATAHLATFALVLKITYDQSSSSTQNFTFTLPVEAARTVATGNYFTSQTWTADQTYEITGTQNFNAGLTIQPGTTVKVAPGVDININGGTFKAEGTVDKPILLTRLPQQGGQLSGQFYGPRTEPVDLTQYKQIRYVSAAHGNDSGNDGSATHPWATVSHALAQITNASAANPYALLVAEGAYLEWGISMKPSVDLYGGFEDKTWTRDIVAHSTILDGNKRDAVILIANNANVRIDGFRICNAYFNSANRRAVNQSGGGIQIYSAYPTISNNFVDNNQCYDDGVASTDAGGIGICGSVYGHTPIPVTIRNNFINGNKSDFSYGGIASDNGEVIIKDNIITNNSAPLAGGIYSTYTINHIENNVIAGNAGQFYAICGGGNWSGANIVYITGNLIERNTGKSAFQFYSIPASIQNNVILKNAGSSYVISNDNYANITITNNTIAYNQGSPLYTTYDKIPVRNCIFYGNGGMNTAMMGIIDHCLGDTALPGSGNITGDPQITGMLYSVTITKMEYDPGSFQTTLYTTPGELKPDSLVNRSIYVGTRSMYVISNTDQTMTVWGDATGAGQLPVQMEFFDYHLKSSSPCIDAGNNQGVSDVDFDGAPRIIRGRDSLTVDIGATEYNASQSSTDGAWGKIYLKNSALNSSLRYCTVELGSGIQNQSSSSVFVSCIFKNNLGHGLDSISGAGIITSCTAIGNHGDGIQALGQTLAGCQTSNNGGVGLNAGNLVNCQAGGNVGDGIKGASAKDCASLNNGGSGLNLTGLALRCTAQSNHGTGIQGTAQQSQAIQNGGAGIIGTATQCYVYGNGGGGISGSATDCQVIGNTGVGVSGSATLTRCLIRDNTGAAANGASVVDGCTITGNGSGLSVGTKITNSYVAANNGQGISGGAVQGSTIVGNQGRGLLSPLSVADSWVMFNQGAGIETPQGNISNSSIGYNGSYGILNPAGGKLVNNCNLYGNGTYEVYTNLNTASGGYPVNTLDFRHNYWGPVTTPLLTANPFPSVNIARIFDLFDNGLSKGWYINYGGAGEFETAPVATAPGDKAPAFLLNVSPDAAHPLNIGPATFTLTFSRAMNISTPLSVTFGTAAPYAANVVAPAPGWVNPVQWQGSFAVQSDTAQGLQTLRVAGAVDTTGFAIPDDTAHTFMIEASGKPSANNGLAIGHGIKMSVSWSEEDKPAMAAGYNVLRSESGLPGTYVKCNGALVTAPAFIDSGLKPYTDYFYIVYLVDSGMNAVQWTPPFLGNTGESRAAVRDWEHYR